MKKDAAAVLGAVRARAGVGHREHARASVLELEVLVGELRGGGGGVVEVVHRPGGKRPERGTEEKGAGRGGERGRWDHGAEKAKANANEREGRREGRRRGEVSACWRDVGTYRGGARLRRECERRPERSPMGGAS